MITFFEFSAGLMWLIHLFALIVFIEEEWNQVAFSSIEPRWILPHLWHSFRRQVGSVEIHFILIDTEALRLQMNNYTEMMEWLENELSTSTAFWKIVAGINEINKNNSVHVHAYTLTYIHS